jgi:hypothetical protein
MKFALGDVVQLKSGGPCLTVIQNFPALAEGEERNMGRGTLKGPAPATYDLVMVSPDGSNIATCSLPEHVLQGVA